MKRAFLGILFLSPLCAAIGVQVINFSMAFFSDAISHSTFTGVALGILFAVNPSISMVIFGLIVGLGIMHVKHKSDFSTDTVVGVFFSGTVALGIVIISAKKGLTSNLQKYLYGDILALGNAEIVWMVVLFIIIGVFLFISYNKLIMTGLNHSLAHSQGINVKKYDYLFAVFMVLVVMSSVRVVGLLLVTAMLIVPAAAGRNIAENLKQMFWYSIGISLFSGILGLIASYYWDSAAGASIVLVECIIFLFTQTTKKTSTKNNK